ncbi:rhomboid family intramembrane serine protease [Salegentibacter sp. HM20]
MKQQPQFLFTTGVVGYPILFVLAIWLVFWFEVRFGVSLNNYGVRPREIFGLRGIVFSPFIHSGLKHLFNNSIPLLVLSMALFYFYRRISWKVLLVGLVLTGVLTWLIGRPANHIGASGIIYMLAAFLFFKGVFSKHYRLVALSLIVVFLYGGMLWYVTPIDPQISWEGHLSGLISGFALSLFFRNSIAKTPKYDWEKPEYREEDDPFMKHFDENGNFIEAVPQPPDGEQEVDLQNDSDNKITYRYIYKKSNEENKES